MIAPPLGCAISQRMKSPRASISNRSRKFSRTSNNAVPAVGSNPLGGHSQRVASLRQIADWHEVTARIVDGDGRNLSRSRPTNPFQHNVRNTGSKFTVVHQQLSDDILTR